jgi:uncharacterized membrane protein YccC
VSAGRSRDALPEVGRRLASEPGRLSANGWAILQTAAAGLAYFLATTVLGNEQPFFAPVAAVVTLGLSFGERGRRALEVALGVVVGLAVADVLVRILESVQLRHCGERSRHVPSSIPPSEPPASALHG